ncbi:IS3 family transposase, partial [Listeria seeligeri]|uniref:IS3 family transposase n=1 Tax=Listeria seeligeri TaxID=1640 RepID=UPI0022EA119C
PAALRRQAIKEKVLECWLKYPMYGYPRLTILVNKIWQLHTSPAFIYGIMRELGIQSRMVKKMQKPKTYTEYEQRPNLIKKQADNTKVLLTDITYIPVHGKWVYLASLYDPVTRRVVAHKIGSNMTKELATSVIKTPLLQRLGTQIIHSDMGSQYTSDLLEHTLVACGIQHSYSRKGCPGDNARIESFHSILKREYVNAQNFRSLPEVIAGIDAYIRWYNEERISLVA